MDILAKYQSDTFERMFSGIQNIDIEHASELFKQSLKNIEFTAISLRHGCVRTQPFGTAVDNIKVFHLSVQTDSFIPSNLQLKCRFCNTIP